MCCCQLGISGWCGVLVGFRSYRRSEKKWDFDWHKSAIHGIFTLRIPSKTLFLVNVRSWIPISPSWKDQIRVPLNHISVVPCFFMEQIEDVLPEKILGILAMPWGQLRCGNLGNPQHLGSFGTDALISLGPNASPAFVCRQSWRVVEMSHAIISVLHVLQSFHEDNNKCHSC